MTIWSSGDGLVSVNNNDRCGDVGVVLNSLPATTVSADLLVDGVTVISNVSVVTGEVLTASGTPGTAHSFTVNYRRFIGGGPGTAVFASETVDGATYGNSPPAAAAPGSVTGSVSGQTVTFSWAAAAGADHYLAYRDGGFLLSTTGLSLTDVPGGGSHSYYVYAVYLNACGTSTSPPSATATVQIGRPSVGILVG